MNLYYETVFRRRNLIVDSLLGFFLAISSWPRLVLEVFIRRNFGERYFSFSGAVYVLVVLGFLPVFFEYGMDLFLPYSRSYHDFHWGSFLKEYLTWYGFTAGFFYMSLKRAEEIKRLPGVYDFARFSLSTGLIDERFYTIKVNGEFASSRTISTLLEPALFLAIGFLLWLIGQPLGILLMVCSVIYSFSYSAAYRQGDHFIMDHIDKMICSEELGRAFIEGRKPSETRGFTFYGPRPADPETRRRVAEILRQDDETVEVF